MWYRTFFVALLIFGIGPTAMAAGSTSSSTSAPTPSKYDQAVNAVDSGKYKRAARLLEKVVKSEPGNADAWNYLGFSYRHLQKLDESLDAYQQALAIDPNHRGANEYLGELYLMTGDVAKAKERLETLKRICTSGCEEYDDLKGAIEAHPSG